MTGITVTGIERRGTKQRGIRGRDAKRREDVLIVVCRYKRTQTP